MFTNLLDPEYGALLFGGFWLLLILLAAVETAWPIHRSPLQPKGRLLTNFGMGLLHNAVLAFLPFSMLATSHWASDAKLGMLNILEAPWPVAAASTILLRSLATYGLHRLSHRSSLLWRLHRVHHSDVSVDLSTGFRNHPLEALVIVAALIAAAAVFGFDPLSLAIYEALALAFTLWSHANVRLPDRIDRIIGKVFITPGLHHVHHSGKQTETDSNYGEVFSFWDRLFGTYRSIDREQLRAIEFGLAETHACSFVRQLAVPFRPERAGQSPATSPSASISRR